VALNDSRPRRAERRAVPGPLRIFLAASFVSNLGSGLTLPFLLIYLHDVRHIGLGISGLLIATTAVLALPVAPAAGAVVDKIGPRFVCLGALLLQAIGTGSLALVHGVSSAIVPIVVYGVGNGAVWPAFFALLAVLTDDDRTRPRIFALNFQLLNLGLGLGSLVAGFAVHVADPSSFVTIYLADGGSTLVVVAVLALLPGRVFARAPAQAPSPPADGVDSATERTGTAPEIGRGGYRQVLRDRRMLRYLVTAALSGFAGYGALSAGFVGFATTVVHVTSRTIAWAFAANTAFIVIAQPLGLRVTSRVRRTTALSLVAVAFGSSWVVLGLAALWPGSAAGDALVIVMLVIFGTGEVLLSPVWGPLVNDLAPPELLGRYNASASGVYSLAQVVSPAIAGVMLGASLGPEYLAVLAACSAGAVVGWRWLRGALTPAEDHAAPGDVDQAGEPAI
jgi:MFS family permease